MVETPEAGLLACPDSAFVSSLPDPPPAAAAGPAVAGLLAGTVRGPYGVVGPLLLAMALAANPTDACCALAVAAAR